MQAIGSVMTFAVNAILLPLSSTAVAFWGVYYKLQNFLMMPLNGLGQAAIPVVGFNYGAKNPDRIRQARRVILPSGVVFALAGTLLFQLLPRQLLGLFSAGEAMLSIGVPALRIISPTFPLAAVTMLCGYFASGLGSGVVNMAGAALRQLFPLVPLVWLLAHVLGFPWVWFALWAAEAAAFAYALWGLDRVMGRAMATLEQP